MQRINERVFRQTKKVNALYFQGVKKIFFILNFPLKNIYKIPYFYYNIKAAFAVMAIIGESRCVAVFRCHP